MSDPPPPTRSLLRLAVKEAVHERAVAEARAQAEREAAAQAEPVETLFDFSSQQKKVSSNGSLFRRMEAHRAAVEERTQQKRQEAEEQERSIMRKASPVRPPSATHWSRRQPEPARHHTELRCAAALDVPHGQPRPDPRHGLYDNRHLHLLPLSIPSC